MSCVIVFLEYDRMIGYQVYLINRVLDLQNMPNLIFICFSSGIFSSYEDEIIKFNVFRFSLNFV